MHAQNGLSKKRYLQLAGLTAGYQLLRLLGPPESPHGLEILEIADVLLVLVDVFVFGVFVVATIVMLSPFWRRDMSATARDEEARRQADRQAEQDREAARQQQRAGADRDERRPDPPAWRPGDAAMDR